MLGHLFALALQACDESAEFRDVRPAGGTILEVQIDLRRVARREEPQVVFAQGEHARTAGAIKQGPQARRCAAQLCRTIPAGRAS
jgi:hypothetical protein